MLQSMRHLLSRKTVVLELDVLRAELSVALRLHDHLVVVTHLEALATNHRKVSNGDNPTTVEVVVLGEELVYTTCIQTAFPCAG